MWSFFCNFMWGPLLISWLLDAVSRLKNLGIFSNSFLCPSTKIGQVTKTFTISIVHLAKSARYGFLVHFLTILHFLGYLCSLVDADVTAEFYGQWSKTSMEKEWSNPSLTFHYTSIYFVIITQLFTLCLFASLFLNLKHRWAVEYCGGKLQPGGSCMQFEMQMPNSYFPATAPIRLTAGLASPCCQT